MASSSNSMEVGVMGCQGEQWTQWILSDTARAELPLTPSKQETLPIGLALDTAATEPVVWGEMSLPAAPFLLILSHKGLLCCFRVINMKAGVQSICQTPTVLTDTTNQFVLFSEHVENSGSSLTVQPIKPIATQAETYVKQPLKTEITVKPSLSVFPAFSTPHPIVTLQEPITSISQSVIPLTESFTTMQTVTTPTEPLPFVMSPVANVSPLQLNETNTIQKEADMLIASLIREECETLEAELRSLLHKASLIKIDLGTDAEATALVQESDMLQNFLVEVVETNTAQSTEIYALKQSLIQTWAWYEDARFRLAQTRDTTLEALLRLQQLDPVSQRYLTELKQMSYYLDSQIKQAGQVLDEQWSNFQDKCKKIIRTKIPTMETIYQTIVRHSIVLEKQKYVLRDIANRNRTLRSRLSGPSLLKSLNDADLLEKSLRRLQLEPEQHFLEAQYEMVLQKQKCFTQTKIDKLITLLKNREVTNIKISKPQFSNNLQSLLQSSPRIKKSMDSTLIGAGLSPITTKPATLWNDTFMQSTPRSTVAANIGIHKSATTAYEQKNNFGELPKTITSSVNDYSQSKFIVTSSKSNTTSAFVPTTQLAFSFTNKNVTATKSDSLSSSAFTYSGPSLFTFGTSIGSTTSVTTPKVMTSLTSTDKKSLLSTSHNFAPTSSFGTATQNIFTSSLPKTTISTSFIPKSTTSANFNLKFSAPSTTFATVVPNSTSASGVNFAPGVATSTGFVVSSTSTGPQWFRETGFGATSSTSASTIANTISSGLFTNSSTMKPSEEVISSSGLESTSAVIPASSIPSAAFTVSGLQTDKTFLSTNVFGGITKSPILFTNTVVTTQPAISSFSFVISNTTASSATVASPTTSTVGIVSSSAISGVPLSTNSNTSGGIFVNTNTVASFLSVTSSPLAFAASTSINTTTLFTGTITTSGTYAEKPENKSVFGLTTSTSDASISTSIAKPISTSMGNSKLSIDFNAVPTTSPVVFNSAPITQTSTFDSKPGPINEASAISSVGAPNVATTITSLFGNTTSQTKPIFGSPFNTQSNIFGKSTNTITSTSDSNKTAGMFSGGTSATASNLFQSANSAIEPRFGTSGSYTGVQNVFGSISSNAPTTSLSFGAAVNTPSNTQSIFATLATPLTSASVFGSPISSSIFSFGTAATSNTNLFGSVTTTAGGSIFGTAPTTTTSLFSSPISSPMTSPIFGAQSTQSSSIFGSSASTTASIFGTATTTATPIFGSSPFTNTSSSVFGSTDKPSPFGTASSGSIFNQQSTFGGATAFGSPAVTSANAFDSHNSGFGTPQSAVNNSFDSVNFTKPFSFTVPPTSTSSASFGFGSLNMGSDNSAFSGQAANPFAKPFGGSIFDTPSTTASSVFGSDSSSTFGFGSTSGFGSSTFGQQPTFAQQSGFGSPSQPGPFSGGNQSVSQSGFGGFSQETQKSGFGSTSMFNNSPGSFGSSPTFGGSAFNTSFGSPNKVFGDSSNSNTGVFGTSSPPQQNSTFANLANQNTIGFGALAQQSQQSPSNQSGFSGGSSFSTWR